MPKITPQNWVSEDTVNTGPELWTPRLAGRPLSHEEHHSATTAAASCTEKAPHPCLLVTVAPSVADPFEWDLNETKFSSDTRESFSLWSKNGEAGAYALHVLPDRRLAGLVYRVWREGQSSRGSYAGLLHTGLLYPAQRTKLKCGAQARNSNPKC